MENKKEERDPLEHLLFQLAEAIIVIRGPEKSGIRSESLQKQHLVWLYKTFNDLATTLGKNPDEVLEQVQQKSAHDSDPG